MILTICGSGEGGAATRELGLSFPPTSTPFPLLALPCTSPSGSRLATMAIHRVPPALVFAVVLVLLLSAAYEASVVDRHANSRTLVTGDLSSEVTQGRRIAGMSRDEYLNPSAPR